MVVKTRVGVDPSRNWLAPLPVDPTTQVPVDLPVNRLPVPAEPAKTLPSFLQRKTAADMPAVPAVPAMPGAGEMLPPDPELEGYQPFDPASIADPVLEAQALENIYRSGIEDSEEARYRQQLAENELAGRQQYHEEYDPVTGQTKQVPIERQAYTQARFADITERPDIPMELASNIHVPEEGVQTLQELGTRMHSTFYPSRQKVREALIGSRDSTKVADFNAHRNEFHSMLSSSDPQMAPAQQYLAEALPQDITPDEYDMMVNVAAASSMLGLKGLVSLGADEIDQITGEPSTSMAPNLMPEEKHVKALQHFLANAADRIPGSRRIFTPQLMSVLPAIIDRLQLDLGYLEKVTNPRTGETELRRTSLASGEKLLANMEVAEVLAGDYLRKPASLVPVNEKASVTAPAKGIKGSGKQSVSQAVINILGSIGEGVNDNALLDTTLQFEDIIANYNPELGYSTSIWADRKGLGEKTYNSLLARYKRERDPVTNRPLYTEEEHRQRALNHVRDAMWGEETDETGIESAVMKMRRSLGYAKTINAGKRPVYTGRIRDPLNQRMYRNRAMTDVGADKVGMRDMLTPFAQGGLSYKVLFDEKQVLRLQNILGSSKQVPWGRKFSEWYNRKFTPEEQMALEYMSEATRHILREDSPDWDNAPWEELVLRYKPSFGHILANRGDLLQQWRAGQTSPEIDENNKLLADIDKGEWLSYAAVWDDLANIRKLEGTAGFHQLTSVITDDGTQNGIFLQALYAGLADKAQQLGAPGKITKDNEPWSSEDLRKVLWNTVFSANAKEGLTDGVKTIWDQFFHALETQSGDKFKGLLNTFGKAALMQYAYGKNAAMFSSQMEDFLSEVAGKYPKIYQDLIAQYNGEDLDENSMLKDLTQIMCNSLINTLSPGFTDANKKLGFGFSWLNITPTINGATNDDYEFGQRELGILYLDDDVTKFESLEDEEGNLFIAGTRMPATVSLPGGDIRQLEFSRSARAIKPATWFFDRKKQQYNEYIQFIGQGLSNQLGVMPVQCMDGDLLKLMIMHVNADRKVPMYIDTVHDSIRTTAASRRHYINAYNNIAIPQITKWMETYRSQLINNYFDNRKKLIDKVMEDRIPIIIGLNGKHAAMGAYIDAQYNKYYGPSAQDYHERITREYGEHSYIKGKNKADEFLKEAHKLGWIPEGEPIITGKLRVTDPDTIERFRNNMAIAPGKFEKLFELLEKHKNINHKQLELWARNGPAEVKRALRALINDQNVQRFGIYQMGTR